MYVLILVIFTGSTTGATTTAEFMDKEACEKAIIEVTRSVSGVYLKDRTAAVCVPKGSKPYLFSK